jgi:hypothetical protein
MDLQPLGELRLREFLRLDFGANRNSKIVLDLHLTGFLRRESEVLQHIASRDVARFICRFSAWHLFSLPEGAA